MNCRDSEARLGIYLDGELDPAGILEVEAHLRACPACAASLDNRRRLAASVAAAYHPAPAKLRSRLERRIARRSWRPVPWLAAAAGVALAALLIPRLMDSNSVAKEVIQAHARSVMAGPLVGVRAGGRHTVRPWLASRLDFTLDGDDISSRGFVLAGGRVDYLAGRTVAALVYQRADHVINVFVWPAAGKGDQPPRGRVVGGFAVVNWRADGMNWWAVSDLGLTELEQLPLCACFLPVHPALRG